MWSVFGRRKLESLVKFLILILKVAIDATELFLSGALLSHCNFSLYWSIELLRLRIGVQGLLVLGSALYF
jgi:hypothetical protein